MKAFTLQQGSHHQTALRKCLFVLAILGQIGLSSSLLAQHEHHGGQAAEDRVNDTQDASTGSAELAAARRMLHHKNGGLSHWMFLSDRLEYQKDGEQEVALFDWSGWYGKDLNRLLIEAEGELDLTTDEFEDAELRVYFSHAISKYFDVKVGLRHDIEPTTMPGGDRRTHAAFGLRGLAPYWFEVDGEVFLSEDGDVSARIETEYEVLFTQRLIGQFRFELDANVQEVPELSLGSGLSSTEAGFRLRYEIKREFAPYVGIAWKRAFGGTADFLRDSGDDTKGLSGVVGLRFWY